MGGIPHHALVLALLFACKGSAPRDTQFDDPAQAADRVKAAVTTCDGVTRVLDQLARSRVGGRLLIGLVDDAIAAAQCADVATAIKGSAAAHQLARARLSDAKPDAALLYLTASQVPAVRLRRAELLDRAGKTADAARELDGLVLDDDAAALQRMLLVSIAARAKNADEVFRLLDVAPLPERPRLAHRAVEDAGRDTLELFARGGPLELALATADKLEPVEGPA